MDSKEYFIILSILVLDFGLCLCNERPNIVLIVTDDQDVVLNGLVTLFSSISIMRACTIYF